MRGVGEQLLRDATANDAGSADAILLADDGPGAERGRAAAPLKEVLQYSALHTAE